MKLTRGKRIALELLGPPALGAAIFLLAFVGVAARDVIDKNKDMGRMLDDFGGAFFYVLFFAYILVGVQSIFYTIIMEWRFKRGLEPHGWRMVGLSTALAFGSGAVLALVKINDPTEMGILMLIFGGLGLVVGFLMGLLIKWWSTEKKTTGANPP